VAPLVFFFYTETYPSKKTKILMIRKLLIGLLTVLSFGTAFYAILVFRPNTPESAISIPGRTAATVPPTKTVPTPAATQFTAPPDMLTTPPTTPEISVPDSIPPPMIPDPATLPETSKHIIVTLKDQNLRYFEGD
jgi:hypothetical protein